MRREREAYEDSLAIVRRFNARLSAKKTAWHWPTIGAAPSLAAHPKRRMRWRCAWNKLAQDVYPVAYPDDFFRIELTLCSY